MLTALAIFIITYIFIGLPAGLLSALFVNDTICLPYTPIVLAIEEKMAQGAEIPVANTPEKQLTVTVLPSSPAAARRTFRVVLLCDTLQTRTRGLQGFRKLQADEAALFIFDKPEKVTFWMGSVSYAIDIVFVGPDEKVVRTYADCRPGSPDLYPSGQAIKWVVETEAGSGIKAGDRVRVE